MKLCFSSLFFYAHFREGGESVKMQRRDLLEQAGQLINGMRSLCQLLECPGVPPITEDVLAVFECVDDEVLRLIDEAMKLDSDDDKE